MATTLKTKNSVTTTVTPTTLAQGELAVNITDKKMWVGNAATTPVQILGAGATNRAGGSNTQVQYNSSGDLAGSANMTFSGTALTLANDASISGLTVGKGGGASQDNTVLGYLALNVNTTGAYNTAVGRQALTSNITGAENAAFGWSSLYSNTGSNNTALGATSLYANTSGGSNTAVGNQALRFNTTASNNTAVGYQAGYSNTTGTPNTALGYRALYSNTTGTDNIGIGYNAGYGLTTGASNIAIGSSTLQNNNASQSIAIGTLALVGSSGSYNIGIGYQSLYSNTTASNNTAVGYQAGYSNTTGARNVFIGYQAGYTSNYNGNAYNTATGYQAGYSLTTGDENTFYGDEAGYGTTTGRFNCFVGTASGSAVTTGSKNTILGTYNGNQGGLDIRTSSGFVVLSDGDGTPLVVTKSGQSLALEGAGSFAGRGITFPATQSASSDANTLDDYEEGTYTATLTPSLSGTITLNAKTLSYTKIGRQVTVTGYIDTASVSSPNGAINLNLPFATSSSATKQSAGLFLPNSLNSGNILNFWCYVPASSNNASIFTGGSANVTFTSANLFGATTEVRIAITYFVD